MIHNFPTIAEISLLLEEHTDKGPNVSVIHKNISKYPATLLAAWTSHSGRPLSILFLPAKIASATSMILPDSVPTSVLALVHGDGPFSVAS